MVVAGAIFEIGEGSEEKFKVGEKVGGESQVSLSNLLQERSDRFRHDLAAIRNGGLGEFCLADVGSLVKLEESLDPAEACILLFNASKLAASYKNNVYNKEDLVVIHGEGFVLSCSLLALCFLSIGVSLSYLFVTEVTLVSLSMSSRSCLTTTRSPSALLIQSRLPPTMVFKRNSSFSLVKMTSENLFVRWVLLVLSSVSPDFLSLSELPVF